jgi:hypothetical protein
MKVERERVMTSIETLEIRKEKWREYFEDLGRIYGGWAVTLELLLGELGHQRRIDNLPLRGLSYEAKGSRAGDILIETGDLNLPFEVHQIHRPTAVRASAIQPGAEIDVEIEAEEGERAVIRIRCRPSLPPAEQP